MSSGALARKDHAHRILVVEDNGNARDSLVMLLEAEGFEVEGVENGREALRVLRGGYDACLILLDLMMPIMDGWTFRVEQRHDPRLAEIPVAVLTATVNPSQEAQKLGAVAAFQKPLDIPRLLELVARYCSKTR
jgi:CheY-like chemotaxis protein